MMRRRIVKEGDSFVIRLSITDLPFEGVGIRPLFMFRAQLLHYSTVATYAKNIVNLASGLLRYHTLRFAPSSLQIL